jgi:hypothetical protein
MSFKVLKAPANMSALVLFAAREPVLGAGADCARRLELPAAPAETSLPRGIAGADGASKPTVGYRNSRSAIVRNDEQLDTSHKCVKQHPLGLGLGPGTLKNTNRAC